jgi:thiol-disulfide isomerase/thioredoxin
LFIVAMSSGASAGKKSDEPKTDKKSSVAKAIPLQLAAGKGLPAIETKSELTKEDAADAHGKLFKLYTINLQSGKQYRIYMKGSKGLDAFVRVEDEAGKFIEEDKFGDEPADSAIEFVPEKTARYRIIATSYKAGMTGNFTLSATEQVKKPDVPPPLPKADTILFKKGEATIIKGSTAKTDPKDSQGKWFKLYAFQGQPGHTYQFEATGQDKFDPELRVEDIAGKVLKIEDKGDPGFSRVSFTPTQAAMYRLVVAGFNLGTVGSFTLTARDSIDPQPANVAGKAQVLNVDVGKPATVQGQITAADARDPMGKFFKVFAFQGQPGKTYRFEMTGQNKFDPELKIEDTNGKLVKMEDKGDTGFSRVTFAPTQAGTFRLIAGGFMAGTTGNFTLTASADLGGAVPNPPIAGKAPKVEAMPAFQQVMSTEILSQLGPEDGTDKEGKPFKVFTFKAKPNMAYIIKMHGRSIDAQVRLEDAAGQPVKNEDFFDGRLSQLIVTPDKGGEFRVIVSTVTLNQFGNFSLSITEKAPTAPAVEPATFDRVARITGALTVQDAIDKQGKFHKMYVVKTKPGLRYSCELTSKGFDAYLRVEDAKGIVIKTEDSGDKSVSRLTFKAEADGVVRVVASSLIPGQTGAFNLTIAESDKGGSNPADVPTDVTPPPSKDGKAVVLTLKDEKASVAGALATSDPVLTGKRHFKGFTFQGEAGKTYKIDLHSKAFDAYLYLKDAAGVILAENDDNGESLDSRIIQRIDKTGTFQITATSLGGGATGPFVLSIAVIEAGTLKVEKLTGLGDKAIKVQGELTNKDGIDTIGKFLRAYAFQAEKGRAYRFEIVGEGGFDPQVRIADNTGRPLKEEDFGDGKSSKVTFMAPESALFRVMVSTFKPSMVGKYTLAANLVDLKVAKTLPLKFEKGAATISSSLTKDDARDTLDKFYKAYALTAQDGKSYKIQMTTEGGETFDPLVRVQDAAGLILQDEQSGDGKSSRLTFKAPKAGTYHVIASSFERNQTGGFTLNISEDDTGDKAPPQKKTEKATTPGDKLLDRLKQLPDASPAERKKIVQEVLQHLEGRKGKFTPDDANIAQDVGQELEQSDKALAATTYTAMGKLLTAAPDAEIVRQGKILLGAGKRLGLVGQTMVVKGTTVDGQNFDLAKLKGKVVLVDFWATWCPPCRAELPNVKKLYDRYHAQGFEVIGISLDNKEKDLTAFLDKDKLPWPSIFKEGNDLADSYGVFSIPLAILVGRDGRVLSLNARGAELDRLLEQQFSPKKE